VLDFEHVMYLDSTGADALLALARTCQAQGVRLIASALATSRWTWRGAARLP
jgi:anti-anti-sigma regulatory factor